MGTALTRALATVTCNGRTPSLLGSGFLHELVCCTVLDRDPAQMSVREMKTELAKRGVDVRGFLEKTDFVEALGRYFKPQNGDGSSTARVELSGGILDLSRIPKNHREILRRCVTVVTDFVTEEEELAILTFAESKFRSLSMEYMRGPGLATGGSIDRYREFDSDQHEFGTGLAGEALKRLRSVMKILALTQNMSGADAFALESFGHNEEAAVALKMIDASVPDTVLYPMHRVIDLEPEGGIITPHVDEQENFGRFVLVLNLISDSIIRLRRMPPLPAPGRMEDWEPNPEEYVDVMVPRRGVYLLEGLSRYAYAHEVLGGDYQNKLTWGNRSWQHDRRLSVVTRDFGPTLSPLDKKVFEPTKVGEEVVGTGTHWPCRGDERIASQPMFGMKLQQWLDSFHGLGAAAPAI